MRLNILVGILVGAFFIQSGIEAFSAEEGWSQSYSEGYEDQQGSFAGGREIMHLVSP